MKAIDGPLNMMAFAGAQSARHLGRIGFGRVSVGPGVMQVPLAAASTVME